MLANFLVALSMLIPSSTPVYRNMERTFPAPPTLNLSAIRHLICADGEWEGTGFLIAPHVLVTAAHMTAEGTCIDEETGSQLYEYKKDGAHDLTLLTSPELPTDMPYIKISCKPFQKGEDYMSYGITSYGQDRDIFRMNTLTFSGKYGTYNIDGKMSGRMGYFGQVIAPGMSGGPVVDKEGAAHALNNAGSSEDTILYEFADGILCK